MNSIRICKEHAFPTTATVQTFAFIGAKGTGKTFSAMALAEQSMEAGAPVVILDPVGNWYGLRQSIDGKSSGYPIPVFGGEFGDVPISEADGAVIARLVVTKRMSAVIDVSRFRKAQRKRFVADLAEELFHESKSVREPLLFIIEEAQTFLPQHPEKGEERMSGALTDIVRLGRNYGIGVVLISQRPQSIDKEALNVVEALFVGQLIGRHERDAIKRWTEANGTQDMTNDLPGLQVGEMIFWSPRWIRWFGKVHMLKKKTLDTSATPMLGKRSHRPVMSKIDITEIRSALSATIERSKQDDPKELRKIIADRDAEIRRLSQLRESKPAPIPEPKIVEVPVLLPGHIDEFRKLGVDLETLISRFDSVTSKFFLGFGEISEAQKKVLSELRKVPAPPPALPNRPVRAPIKLPERHAPLKVSAGSSEYDELPKASKAILMALAQLDGGFPEGVDRGTVGLIAGYSARSSTFKNALTPLANMEAIERVGGSVKITPLGLDLVGPIDPLPTGRDLQAYWLNHPRLGKASRAILNALIASGKWMSRDSVGEQSGYSPNSSTFKNALTPLSNLKLIEKGYEGLLRVSSELL